MNAVLPPVLARALAPLAPPKSVVHKIVADADAEAIDRAMLADKLEDGYGRRRDAMAMEMQRKYGSPA